MKIKNIIWIFLAALSFASCTKDNEGDNIPQEPVDAVISLTAVASNQKTKADANTVGRMEDWIKSLNAYVFKNTTGELAGYKRVEDLSLQSRISEIDGILIKIVPGADGKSTEQFTLVLLANIGDQTFNSLNDLKKATSLGGKLADYKVGSSFLPMVSEILTFTGVKKSEKNPSGGYTTNNWVNDGGGTVAEIKNEATEVRLTRMVSRVEVDEVSINLSGTDYEGSTFSLKTIALVNVRTGVDVLRQGIGSYVKGYQSTGYNYIPVKDKGWWIPTTAAETYTTTLEPSLSQSYTFAGIANGEYTFDEYNASTNPQFFRYVFPNAKISAGAEYETGVVVGGIFKYQSGKEALKHFIVKLNDPNASDKSPEVLANTVYKLKISIEGEGSEDENHPQETAGIKATITVKDWEVIEQNENLPPIKPEE